MATRRPSGHARARRARAPRPLGRGFYNRPVLGVAADALGRVLVHDGPEGRVAGRIVELEAYGGTRDPASHGFRGSTARNAMMFGPAGRAYVYFTYGMHHCVNLVCDSRNRAAALLVRALEPLEGIELMQARRGTRDPRRLARGPGCVAQALGLDRRHNGLDLTRGPLWLADVPARRGSHAIARGPRIGITAGADLPWRFFLLGHPCVSGPAGRNRARVCGVTVRGRGRARG